MPMIRHVKTAAVTALLALAGASVAGAQTGETSTYRVILYLAEDGGPSEVTLERMHEVWSEDEGVEKLQELLSTARVRRLEDVTILPGRDTPALKLGDVTVRVRGVYREPRRDSMFLRLEVDGGAETLVKEMISKFDETIVVAYPLAEGDRSVVALIVPTELGS